MANRPAQPLVLAPPQRAKLEALSRSRQKRLRGRVEIILAVYKAAETGRTIELPLKNDPVLKARPAGK